MIANVRKSDDPYLLLLADIDNELSSFLGNRYFPYFVTKPDQIVADIRKAANATLNNTQHKEELNDLLEILKTISHAPGNELYAISSFIDALYAECWNKMGGQVSRRHNYYHLIKQLKTDLDWLKKNNLPNQQANIPAQQAAAAQPEAETKQQNQPKKLRGIIIGGLMFINIEYGVV